MKVNQFLQGSLDDDKKNKKREKKHSRTRSTDSNMSSASGGSAWDRNSFSSEKPGSPYSVDIREY